MLQQLLLDHNPQVRCTVVNGLIPFDLSVHPPPLLPLGLPPSQVSALCSTRYKLCCCIAITNHYYVRKSNDHLQPCHDTPSLTAASQTLSCAGLQMCKIDDQRKYSVHAKFGAEKIWPQFRNATGKKLWHACIGGHGLSTAKPPVRGESPRARDPIALASSITAWRVAYRELAEDLLSIAKPQQRGCPPCSGPFALGRSHHASTPRQGARPQGLEGVEGGDFREKIFTLHYPHGPSATSTASDRVVRAIAMLLNDVGSIPTVHIFITWSGQPNGKLLSHARSLPQADKCTEEFPPTNPNPPPPPRGPALPKIGGKQPSSDPLPPPRYSINRPLSNPLPPPPPPRCRPNCISVQGDPCLSVSLAANMQICTKMHCNSNTYMVTLVSMHAHMHACSPVCNGSKNELPIGSPRHKVDPTRTPAVGSKRQIVVFLGDHFVAHLDTSWERCR